MAIADGALVDATQGEFAEVSGEHFPEHHVAMTKAVFAIIAAGVEAAERAEFAGIWHNVLQMSCVCPVRPLPGGHMFKVEIRAGCDLRSHELKIIFHGGDNGEPCATVMLPEEE